MNSDCTLHLGNKANRFHNLTLSSLEATSGFCWFIKFVTLPLIVLFFFCWSTLGALATELEDLFCDCEDALDLVLGYCGGGGQELCFLEGDEEGGGGGVFSFVGPMKMEDEEEEKETSVFSRVMARNQGR